MLLRESCSGYDWTSVPHGGLFVDVGGNIGSIVREVVKIRPDLHFVIEDRPLVVEKAKAVSLAFSAKLWIRCVDYLQYWANVAPEVLATGHINMIGLFLRQLIVWCRLDIFL